MNLITKILSWFKPAKALEHTKCEECADVQVALGRPNVQDIYAAEESAPVINGEIQFTEPLVVSQSLTPNIDMDRIKAALASTSTDMPQGLTREQKREKIISAAKKTTTAPKKTAAVK